MCLAHWKDGSTRYLVGQLQHKMATSDEDRYRCFVWERRSTKIRQGYDVAQSGDATCNGLLSPTEGSRTMRLTKGKSLRPHLPQTPSKIHKVRHHTPSDSQNPRLRLLLLLPRLYTHPALTFSHPLFNFSPGTAIASLISLTCPRGQLITSSTTTTQSPPSETTSTT